MKKANYFWEYKDYFLVMIKTALQNKNQPETILKKVGSFINNHSENFLRGDHVSMWKDTEDNYKSYERCFKALKSGFVSLEKGNVHLAIRLIEGVAQTNENKYVLYHKENIQLSISKRDYEDVKRILM